MRTNWNVVEFFSRMHSVISIGNALFFIKKRKIRSVFFSSHKQKVALYDCRIVYSKDRILWIREKKILQQNAYYPITMRSMQRQSIYIRFKLFVLAQNLVNV